MWFWIACATILFVSVCWFAYALYNAPDGDDNGVIKRSTINKGRKSIEAYGAPEGADHFFGSGR